MNICSNTEESKNWQFKYLNKTVGCDVYNLEHKNNWNKYCKVDVGTNEKSAFEICPQCKNEECYIKEDVCIKKNKFVNKQTNNKDYTSYKCKEFEISNEEQKEECMKRKDCSIKCINDFSSYDCNELDTSIENQKNECDKRPECIFDSFGKCYKKPDIAYEEWLKTDAANNYQECDKAGKDEICPDKKPINNFNKNYSKWKNAYNQIIKNPDHEYKSLCVCNQYGLENGCKEEDINWASYDSSICEKPLG